MGDTVPAEATIRHRLTPMGTSQMPSEMHPPLRPKATIYANVRDSLSMLGQRRFGTFWFASLLSSIGTWTQQVAEPWLLLTLGASSFLIGLDSFAMNAPLWVLILVGGLLADRYDRRRVIALFQGIQMLCPVAIVVLLAGGQIHPWMIIVLSVVVGVTDALSMPSFQSIVPSIVERDQIARGLALNSTQFNLSRILGPTIAGILMSSIGALSCFVVSAVSYVPFIGIALWILPRWTPSAPHPVTGAAPRHFAGIREIARQPYLLGALGTIFATSVFCSPLITFIPVLVKGEFHGDASRFSIALASFGAGGLLGAAILLGLAPTADRRRWSSLSALSYGAVLAGVAIIPWFWGLPILLVVAGALMTVVGTSVNTLLQFNVRPQLLGQVVSLYMLAVRGGFSVGALLTGFAVDAIGIRQTLMLDGLMAMLAQLILLRSWLKAPLPISHHATLPALSS
jgi:predicted MFS family arabinose efflux permease